MAKWWGIRGACLAIWRPLDRDQAPYLSLGVVPRTVRRRCRIGMLVPSGWGLERRNRAQRSCPGALCRVARLINQFVLVEPTDRGLACE
jgi:hypothetical protein